MVIAEGMTVDAERMRGNLDATQGLIMAEAVMMALAGRLGRQAAHEAVEHASAAAIERHISLAEALAADAAITAHVSREEIARITDPAGYLGDAPGVIDRVVARARARLGRGGATTGA